MFAHFALAAAVLTKVLHIDFLLLKNYAVPLDKDLVDKIGKAKQIALWGLAGLIVTGAALVVYGMVTSQGYLNNPKLWVKFICMAVLTANGYLVHLLGRHVKEQTVLADFSYGISVLIFDCRGGVCSASRIFACWLGIARAWNKVMPF